MSPSYEGNILFLTLSVSGHSLDLEVIELCTGVCNVAESEQAGEFSMTDDNFQVHLVKYNTKDLFEKRSFELSESIILNLVHHK